jgi:HAD superfamily hydrolase (TIGR01509 family)
LLKERALLERIAALLLDMDGTLVDSDASVERAWTTWAHEYGVDAKLALVVSHGSPSLLSARRLLPGHDEAAIAAAAQHQLELQYGDLQGVGPMPGAGVLLHLLDRLALPWAVVTSADRRLASERLGAAGIDPPLLVTFDDVTAGKPDPESYLLAARRLGVAPARCLVVEDSEAGLAAGRAAGMLTAALRGLVGDVRIADLTHLAHILGSLLGPDGR